ncbi:MAG: iron-sulfur cluster assembly scaffold protein [Candidatus Lokiarchaeota archaeon]
MDDKKKHTEEEVNLNEYILNLSRNPKNIGELSEDERSILYSYKGSCGDTMTFFLKVNHKCIEKARFVTDGCAAATAAASQTMQLIEGKSIKFAKRLKAKDIDKFLGGLPSDHKHCAKLAIKTLHKTLNKYKKKIRN